MSNLDAEEEKQVIIYPAPLNANFLGEEPDEGIFTLPEKAALKTSWPVLKRIYARKSIEHFANFYNRNHGFIPHFRGEGRKIKLHTFAKHIDWILDILGSTISFGLKDDETVFIILQKLVVCHRLHLLPLSDVMTLLDEIEEWLLLSVKDVRTKTLDNALHKLFETMKQALKLII